MNMLRTLLVMLLIVVLARLLRRVLRGATPAARGQGPQDGAVTPTVRCARCGTFVPAADAVVQGGMNYCSPEHSSQGPVPPA
jgi:uncharacterized protein